MSVPTPRNAPSLYLGDLDHSSDTSTTEHVSPFPYQSDHVQPFGPPGRTIPKMTQLVPRDICGFHRAGPTNPQQDSSADTAGIPSVPLFAGSTVRDNIVHTNEEHAPPTTSQVTDLPPSYSDIAGPAEQQSPSREGMGGV
ncbi:hypothetical protein M404DRAFT_1003816 [Pisolithus tinctorius Marx 270]|uniref:Uncharacterized protein n=1 Tax=Pisolithus tinctorius Marx 270 TaxID=870435 RepID=A0A0C3IU45_PISTI|nr:hypothetical protein M404DRAFT_1003816 [Pisolithus tinctorius Marx 270]